MPASQLRPYIGRFAPSPTGPLHAGSLVAALASWLDARAHGGRWLVRIEDVDGTRCQPGLAQHILRQLADCGLVSDQPVIYQSQRAAQYQQALDALVARGAAYPCACSRKDIAAALLQGGQHKLRHGALTYPGTCRAGLHGRPARGWRLRTDIYMENQPLALMDRALQATNNEAFYGAQAGCFTGHSTAQWSAQRAACAAVHPAACSGTHPVAYCPDFSSDDSPDFPRPGLATDPVLAGQPAAALHWHDRRLGPQQQDVAAEVGDFILKRADGCFAYQLAVVQDDADQGITDVVRGADLADNTARQILLQQALGWPTPRYLHTPLVLGPNGEKLSKQNGAQALDLADPLRALNQAASVLALPAVSGDIAQALRGWTAQWQTAWQIQPQP